MVRVVRGSTVVAAGAGAGVLVARRVAAVVRGQNGVPALPDDGKVRWHAVTVAAGRDEVAPSGALPEPLAELGDAIEVRIETAPGGKGTEIHARPVTDAGNGSVKERTRQLRAALRKTRQIIETGEVLRPDRPGSTRPTPLNAPLRHATAHGLEEGRL